MMLHALRLPRILASLTAGIAAALLLPGAATAISAPTDDPFYHPPAALLAGEPGSIVWSRPSAPQVTPAGAASATTVIYRSRAIDGSPSVVSGDVLLPKGTPPAGGWPVVAWGHVTTGAGDGCAPTNATVGEAEFERKTRSAVVAQRLLERGIAVARTDYEGIGTPGPHPYLVGRSLARSMVDMVRAARALSPTVGRTYLAAGHSEGGVAALWTGYLGPQIAPELRLRGVAAVAPALGMADMVRLGRHLSTSAGALGTLSALAGLVAHGAAVADPALAQLLANGGLSDTAHTLESHLEDRCLEELGRKDSWGGVAPADLIGPTPEPAMTEFIQAVDANDPTNLRFPKTLPMRLDQGTSDPVTIRPFADRFAVVQRLRGAQLTYRTYLAATHQTITSDRYAAVPLADWAKEHLR